MGTISQDLRKAEQELEKMLTWGQVVRALSKQNHETETDTARWLLMKEADMELNTFAIERAIPTMIWSEDHKSVAKKILNSYVFIENGYVAALRNIMGGSSPAYWDYGVYIKDINKLLVKHKLPEILLSTLQTIEVEPVKELTKPQQREIELLKYLQGDDGYPDMAQLPTEAKRTARKNLTASNPQLFTNSTFDQAWGALSARGEISLADKDKYTKK